MSASSVLQASTLALFLGLAAGCASSAPRTQAQSPAPATPALDTPSAGLDSTASSSSMEPHDYDWTMTEAKPRTAKTDPLPAADLKPAEATSGQSVLKSAQ
jgi:hypothetical protein